MMEVKEYYSMRSLQDDKIRNVNRRVIHECLSFNPLSILEFGCNNGKNLTLIPTPIEFLGIDINKAVIKKARQNKLNVTYGDESFLKNIEENMFDVTFTCSVLNHIENIDDIVGDLKRIAKKGVVCVEYNHEKHWRWFSHNYEKLGFTHNGTIQSLHRLYDVWIMFL